MLTTPVRSHCMRRTALAAALMVSCALMACGKAAQELPPCWKNDDIEIGRPIKGIVIIESSPWMPAILLPLMCEGGGGIAELPAGFQLDQASRNGRPVSSFGAHFYKARIEGVAKSRRSTGNYFSIEKISEVEGTWPSWMSPEHQDR